jgi:predicted Rdx family selenoprotein
MSIEPIRKPDARRPLRVRSRALSAATRVARRAVWLLALFVASFTLPSFGQDVAQLRKDVLTASDFRVRVSSALALGKKKDGGSVSTLGQALKDDNAAVRSAAAAALSQIGDATAVPLLERARSSEKDATVKAAIEKAITALKPKTKYIVTFGKLENKSGNPKVSNHFLSAVKAEVGRIPGVEVASSATDAAQKAKEKSVPTIGLDGRLVTLAKSSAGGDVAFAAKVEFVIRKDQSLKATVKGDAKALASSKSVKGDADLATLQADAVTAAIQSALKGAPTALDAAVK